MKRALILLVVVACMVSMLSGCKKSAADDGKQGVGATSADAKAESSSPTREDASSTSEASETTSDTTAAPTKKPSSGTTAKSTTTTKKTTSPTAAPAASTTAKKTYNGVLSNFSAKDLDGKTRTQSIFAGTKLTMVNVWATWCGPCKAEIPYLGQLDKEYGAGKFQVVGLLSDPENSASAKTILKDSGADYINLCVNWSSSDPLYAASCKAFGEELQYIPATYFVDEHGQQVGGTYVGGRDKAGWKAIIDDILAGM